MPKTSTSKAGLLAAAASATKNLLGGGVEAPKTVKMPQAVSEIHVSPDDVIPAGTVITKEIAELAELDEEQFEKLLEQGHIKLVDVYQSAVAQADA